MDIQEAYHQTVENLHVDEKGSQEATKGYCKKFTSMDIQEGYHKNVENLHVEEGSTGDYKESMDIQGAYHQTVENLHVDEKGSQDGTTGYCKKLRSIPPKSYRGMASNTTGKNVDKGTYSM